MQRASAKRWFTAAADGSLVELHLHQDKLGLFWRDDAWSIVLSDDRFWSLVRAHAITARSSCDLTA